MLNQRQGPAEHLHRSRDHTARPAQVRWIPNSNSFKNGSGIWEGHLSSLPEFQAKERTRTMKSMVIQTPASFWIKARLEVVAQVCSQSGLPTSGPRMREVSAMALGEGRSPPEETEPLLLTFWYGQQQYQREAILQMANPHIPVLFPKLPSQGMSLLPS